MRRIITLATVTLGLVFFTAPSARAGIITQSLEAEIASPGFIGQSLATPAGGPWHNLAISFFNGESSKTPTVSGTAFLLNQEYLGIPANLSSSTPGFLAASTGIVAGQYAFAPGVTVQPNTTYWVYEKIPLGSITRETVLLGTNPYHFAYINVVESEPDTAIFRLSGDVVTTPISGNVVTTPVPAPPAVVLVGLGAGCVALRRYVGRRATA
jgi:hypothetical protein